MADAPFPQYVPPRLPREYVVERLLSLKSQGWSVFTNGAGFIIPIDEDRAIYLGPDDQGFRLSSQTRAGRSLIGLATFSRRFDELLEEAFTRCGMGSKPSPTRGRLSADKPATNLSTISRLIGACEVQAVFDPYLDNAGLAALADILSLGPGTVSSNVRLLTSSKARQNKGGSPRLTGSYVTRWFTERAAVAGEIREMGTSGEHRRFMLLAGGKSLLLGPSLNSLAKNEAVALEPDVEDRPFFDIAWAQARPLPP